MKGHSFNSFATKASAGRLLDDSPARVQVSLEDFRSAETRVRPSAMREIALEVPNVSWGDVGGLEEVKQRLMEAVQWPQQHADALRRIGAKASCEPLMALPGVGGFMR